MLGRAIQSVAPALVHVTAERAAGAPGGSRAATDPGAALALGSGFVVRPDGLVATAYHLARGAARLSVRGIGWPQPLVASLVLRDEESDLALLRVLARDLPHARLHEGPVDLGDEVLFFGFPYADVFDPPLCTTSRGIIGNRYRLGGVDRFVIDAVCAEGLSGGPLVLARSQRVIGVVGARFDPARARAKLAGASADALASLPREPSSITFAAEGRYLAALLAQVR